MPALAFSLSNVVRRGKSFFLATSCVVFFLTAFLKISGVLDGNQVFVGKDVFFGLVENKHLALMAACLEILVCGVIVGVRSHTLKLFSVLWLSTSFGLYRLGLALEPHGRANCGCLGSAGELLGLSKQTLDRLAWWILAYLIVVSTVFLILEQTSMQRQTLDNRRLC